MADERENVSPEEGKAEAPHHPLPADEKARRDEIPETTEREKGYGEDDPTAAQRGQPAGKGSGAVTGSGAGAGGGGTPEDYDQDAQAGSGKLDHNREPRPGRGGDAPVGGSH